MRTDLLTFFILMTATVSLELAPGQKRIFCNTEYEIEQSIGKGSFGRVFRAKAAHDRALVAIKEIKFGDGDIISLVNGEIEVLSLIRGDPNVLQLICASKENEIAYIVTEYCSGGDLALHLKRQGKPIIYAEPVIRNWLAQLVTGLTYLKHKNVLHGDLKAQNILVCYPVSREEDPVLKIADFGNSTILSPGKGVEGIRGTATIVAPEVFRNQPYDQRVDLWALGILIFEATFGRHPFQPFYFPNVRSADHIHAWNQAVSRAIESHFRNNNNRVVIPSYPSISLELTELIQGILCPVDQRIGLNAVYTEANRLVQEGLHFRRRPVITYDWLSLPEV